MGARRSSLLLVLLLSACSADPAPIESAPLPTPAVTAAPSPSLLPSPSPSPSISPSAKPTPSKSPTRKPTPSKTPDPLNQGKGTFTKTAGGGTGVVGTAGVLTKYCIQVEDGVPNFTPDQFAAKVDQVLADSRSWIAGKKWMWQRVGNCGSAKLRIQLATPNTVDRVCATWGVDTEGKYSCRAGNRIMINLKRWTNGVPHFVSLDTYRHMVINHETGHFLGFKHATCPGKGKLAPVMQTQSIALNGCKANAFPYPDGKTFVG